VKEIFDQTRKDRKQIFKKPELWTKKESDDLYEVVKNHMERHMIVNRRWKMAGIVAAITVAFVVLAGAVGLAVAMYVSGGAV